MRNFFVRKTPGILAVLTAVLLVAGGCSSNQPAPSDSSSSLPQSSDSSQPGSPDGSQGGLEAIGLLDLSDAPWVPFVPAQEGDDSPLVDWTTPEGTVIYYVYSPSALQFTGYRASRPESATLLQLALSAGYMSGYDFEQNPLPVKAVRREKSMVIVDFDGAFISELEQDAGTVLLSSLARTFIENEANTYDVGFTVDGGQQLRTDWITLEGDGYGRYECPPLYSQVSDAEYTSIRESLPYPQLTSDLNWLGFDPYGSEEARNAEGAQEVVSLLAMAGNPQQGFSSPDELPNDFKLTRALLALPLASSMEDYDLPFPQLAPIAQAVDDFEMIPREWVEEALRDLWGPDATAIPQNLGKWRWHAREGVYTPPHMGGWGDWLPYVFSIVQTDGGYEVELTYVYLGMGGYQDETGEWIENPADQESLFDTLAQDPAFQNLAQNRLPRYRAMVVRDGNDLYLQSLTALS